MTENGSDSLSFEPPEQENVRLREENARLRRLLAVHSIPIPQLPTENPPTKTVEPAPPVDKEERARQRIALFRSVFRGREDVYARRWENADGRHGYMPAVVKDWKAINKSRPEDRKKVDQKTRKFLPLTDGVIEDHLLGKETISSPRRNRTPCGMMVAILPSAFRTAAMCCTNIRSAFLPFSGSQTAKRPGYSMSFLM